MYIFKLWDDILGICDEEHLKECACDAWGYAYNNNADKDVVIYFVEELNVIDELGVWTTYEFDEYFNGENTCLGLRLCGLGGQIDIPLDIKIIHEDE